DRRLGNGIGDDLGGRDPIHVRHVDIHEDHVRPLFLGEIDGRLTAVGGAGDFHVGFKADQLREVIASVGDVVDDQDAYLLGFGHNSPDLTLARGVTLFARSPRSGIYRQAVAARCAPYSGDHNVVPWNQPDSTSSRA